MLKKLFTISILFIGLFLSAQETASLFGTVMDRSTEEGLEAVKNRIVEQGGTASAKQTDVSDENQVKGLLTLTMLQISKSRKTTGVRK